MKITRANRERPFSFIERKGAFEHRGEIHMRLDRDHMELNTGVYINAVNLERGELKHFDENEFVRVCDAELVITEAFQCMSEREKAEGEKC